MLLTPKYLVLLIKCTSFPDNLTKKIILINKIPVFLQVFEHVISVFTTVQSVIWVGLTGDITLGTGLKCSRDF